MEKVLKDLTRSKEGFKVVEKDDRIESINALGQVFHFIEKKYLSQGIVYHGWVGYRTNDQMKAVLDGHVIEVLSKNKCRRMIADTTLMTGSWTGLQDWLSSYYMPKILKSGLRSQAALLPKNVFAQLALDGFEEEVIADLDTFVQKSFDNEKDAVAWLKTR